MPARLEIAQIQLYLAELAASGGDRERVKVLLGTAVQGFAALRVPYWQEETRRLATGLGVTTPHIIL